MGFDFYHMSLCPSQKVDFQKKFPDADPLAIDLMERMLQFDPRKRCTVFDALKHPWLAQLHDETAEPFAPGACLFLSLKSLFTLASSLMSLMRGQ